jgi:Uma2 family endonuclease
MNVALRKTWTVDEFLAWEERQELRYEFDGFRVIAMTGGSFEHDAIQINLVTALNLRLKGQRCRVHGSNLKIRVMGSIRYPDAYVSCTPVPSGAKVLREPVVIFEVLSPSTARADRTTKNREYAGTASVRRYVMLEQSSAEGMMFVRDDAGEWTGHVLGPDAVLRMPEIGVELPLSEIYDGLELTGDDPDEDQE